MKGVGYTLRLAGKPAPDPIVRAVRQIDVDVSAEEAGMMRVQLGVSRTKPGDWRPLDLDPFLPLAPLSLDLRVGSPVPRAVINTFVLRQQASYAAEPGTSSLEVTAMDKTHFMNLEEKPKPWTNLSDTQIAEEIFKRHKLDAEVHPTRPVLVEPEGQRTQRATDIRFLRELARRNGFECFVQPDPVTGHDRGYFCPRKAIAFPEAVLSAEIGGCAGNLDEFSVRYEMTQPTTVAAAGVDSQSRKRLAADATASTEAPMGREALGLRISPPPVSRPTGHGAGNAGELRALAQAAANRSSWSLVASGRVSPEVGILRPGGLVNVRGVGSLYNGSYLLARVTHRIAPGSYEQRFEARRNAVAATGAEVYTDGYG